MSSTFNSLRIATFGTCVRSSWNDLQTNVSGSHVRFVSRSQYFLLSKTTNPVLSELYPTSTVNFHPSEVSSLLKTWIGSIGSTIHIPCRKRNKKGGLLRNRRVKHCRFKDIPDLLSGNRGINGKGRADRDPLAPSSS